MFRRLVRARDRIQESYAEPLSLDDLAAEAGISPYHFLRQFRRAFGATPHDYLTRVRLDRAKQLLARRGVTVTEACFDVGYSSLGSFSTLFHRRIGCSPAAWQRRVRALVPVPVDLPRLWIPGCWLAWHGL